MTPTIAPGADAHALAQLQSACGCSEQEAQRALSAASGDLTRAKELAAHLVHRYLLVGVTIEERGKSAATEGAILALWERGHPKPRWTGALLTTTAHGAITGWHPTSPHDWGLLLRDRGEKLTAYDRKASQHLADYIQIQTFPIPMDHCFAAPETLPPLVRPGADGEPERCTRDQLLAHSFELMLRGALSFP
ncbi:MAG TPA: hypothetical protein VEI97_13470, partial [bacterium]|nr:hypothetical protein [bacterium]